VTAPARFTQSDLTRAVKGVAAAGLRVAGVKIGADGSIMVQVEGAANDAANPLDRVFKQ
jgi:hypothetical protein